MKKTPRKELTLSTTTVRTLTRALDARALEQAVGGIYALSQSCYTKPLAGCP